MPKPWLHHVPESLSIESFVIISFNFLECLGLIVIFMCKEESRISTKIYVWLILFVL